MLLPEMDPREKATLKNCLNCFLEDLDPTLTFLSQMVCSGVITDDQKDRIEVKIQNTTMKASTTYYPVVYKITPASKEYVNYYIIHSHPLKKNNW